MIRTLAVAAMAAAVVLAVPPGPAAPNSKLLPKVKAAGYPAKNCQYCHVTKLPKKDTFKPDDLNERGKWLDAEKEKQKATEVLVDWLKDYPGGKEQK